MPNLISSEIYQAISFEAGKSPNFELLKSKFIANGLLINNKGDAPLAKNIDDYIAFINKNVKAGNILSLSETELNQRIELFGKIGQITSQYSLSFETQSGKITRYGVNLFQIINDGSQWRVSSMCWDDRIDQSLLK
jgi:hypothetical protein